MKKNKILGKAFSKFIVMIMVLILTVSTNGAGIVVGDERGGGVCGGGSCVETICDDTIDNDADTFIDCADSDCSDNPLCWVILI